MEMGLIVILLSFAILVEIFFLIDASIQAFNEWTWKKFLTLSYNVTITATLIWFLMEAISRIVYVQY